MLHFLLIILVILVIWKLLGTADRQAVHTGLSRVNLYRGCFRIWLAFSLLFMGVLGTVIGVQDSKHQQWQRAHDDWKRRYTEWQKKEAEFNKKKAEREKANAEFEKNNEWVPDPPTQNQHRQDWFAQNAPAQEKGESACGSDREDPLSKIARGEISEITPRDIAQIIQDRPTCLAPSKPVPEPKLSIVRSEPLPPCKSGASNCDPWERDWLYLPPAPEEPTEPHPDPSTENLCVAFFLVPASSYAALRTLAWILRGFRRQA